MDAHFVLLEADRGEDLGADLFNRFKISSTPTILTVDGDGAEVDWAFGYAPPAEKFHERMMKMVSGEGTFRTLNEALSRNPKDVAAAFLLARKWAERSAADKQNEYDRMVVALDPTGSVGTYAADNDKIRTTYTEYAEFALAGGTDRGGAVRSPGAMKAFMAKYPRSPLLRQAYTRLAGYYRMAPAKAKDEAAAFFAEYEAKYPDDPEVLTAWLERIVRDKGDFGKGAEIAERLKALVRANPSVRISRILSDFYLAKGDAEEADRAYGKDFMKDRAAQLALDMVNYANYWAAKGSNLDAAVEAAESAMKLKPGNARFVQQAAGVYVKAGLASKALALFGPAFAQAHWGDAPTLEGYVAFWGAQGQNLDDALAAGRRLVELKPGVDSYWSALGVVLLARKDYEGALRAAEKAVDLAKEAAFKDYYRKMTDRIKAAQAAEKK